MALQIEWTPESKIHLNEILEYWIERNDSKTYARKLYLSFKNALLVLAKYPESGKSTNNQFVRSKIVKDYYIFYSFDEYYLTVLGFCDMRRDPEFIKSLIE